MKTVSMNSHVPAVVVVHAPHVTPSTLARTRDAGYVRGVDDENVGLPVPNGSSSKGCHDAR